MDWIALTRRLPDEDVIVDTKIDDVQGVRNEQPLKRRGRLWFMEDGSMYVYYSPTHWKQADQAAVLRRAEQRLRARAEELARDAAAAGLVVTIEQRPLLPLATGHYETLVAVRRARSST